MIKLLILSLLVTFSSFTSQDSYKSSKGKFQSPKLYLINEITSCICDFNDMYLPNKEIDISNFIDGEKLLKFSKKNKLLIHNRKDILQWESGLWNNNKIYSWILNSHIRTDSEGNLYIDRKLEDLEANTNEIERTGFTEYFKDQEEYLNTLTGDNISAEN